MHLPEIGEQLEISLRVIASFISVINISQGPASTWRCKSHLTPSTTFLPMIDHFKLSPLTAPPSHHQQQKKYAGKVKPAVLRNPRWWSWNWTKFTDSSALFCQISTYIYTSIISQNVKKWKDQPDLGCYTVTYKVSECFQIDRFCITVGERDVVASKKMFSD